MYSMSLNLQPQGGEGYVAIGTPRRRHKLPPPLPRRPRLVQHQHEEDEDLHRIPLRRPASTLRGPMSL